MPHDEGVHRGVAADPAHARDHLVDDRGRERASRPRCAARTPSSPPARMRTTSQPTSRSASSFSRSDASLRPMMGPSRASGIVVLHRDAQLRYQDVGPHLLAAEERARDPYRVHAVVQPDPLGEQDLEALLGLRGAGAEPGVHERHARLAQGARAGGVDRALGAPRTGEHLADARGIPIVPAGASPVVRRADPRLAGDRGALRRRRDPADQLGTRAMGLVEQHAERAHPPDRHDARDRPPTRRARTGSSPRP